MKLKNFSRWEARWLVFLLYFNLEIVYQPGKAKGQPDTLTHQKYCLSSEGPNIDITVPVFATVRDQWLIALASKSQETLDVLWNCAYEIDRFLATVFRTLSKFVGHNRWVFIARCMEREGRLIYDEGAYVPIFDVHRLRFIRFHHYPPTLKLPGGIKTIGLLQKENLWPNMQIDIDPFIRNYHMCWWSQT